MTRIRPVGDIRVVWGESLRWDDRRQRLYFVDCARQTLHWLDDEGSGVETLGLPSIPTAIALTEGAELVVCLADGLFVVDPDAGSVDHLAAYPDGLGSRANDACADGAGNIVTGTLNLGPGSPGGYWWFSAVDGWRPLVDGIGNANGPAVVDWGGPTLVFGDTVSGSVNAYAYDGAAGSVGEGRVVHDHGALGGAPDGATVDAEEAVWSCVLRRGLLARLTPTGLDRTIELPVGNPSDCAFGGPAMDRLYVTSIALDLGDGEPTAESGSLLAVEDLGVRGRPESRFRLG